MKLDTLVMFLEGNMQEGDEYIIQPVGVDDPYHWLRVVKHEDDTCEVMDCFGSPVMRDSWIQDYRRWDISAGYAEFDEAGR